MQVCGPQAEEAVLCRVSQSLRVWLLSWFCPQGAVPLPLRGPLRRVLGVQELNGGIFSQICIQRCVTSVSAVLSGGIHPGSQQVTTVTLFLCSL